MSDSAQKRAIENYRSRLTKRGIARFEIQALDADRELIRTVARKLTEKGARGGTASPNHTAGSSGGAAKNGRCTCRAAPLTAGERRS